MEDRDFVAGLPPRATGVLPDRPGNLPRMKLNSSFVGEIPDADIKEVVRFYGIPSGTDEAAGDAPAIRVAIHRLPGGAVAIVVGAVDDASDKQAEWAPFDAASSRAMLARLRCRPTLEGRDVEELAYVVSYLSWFAHEAPFIATLVADRVAVMETGKGCMMISAKARFGPP